MNTPKPPTEQIRRRLKIDLLEKKLARLEAAVAEEYAAAQATAQADAVQAFLARTNPRRR